MRAIAPIVVGGIMGLLIYVVEFWPDWGPMTRLGAFAMSVFLSYKGPELYLSNKATKRTKEIQKGLPDSLSTLPSTASPRNWAAPIPNWATNSR